MDREAELICHLTIRFRVGCEKYELMVITCVALGPGVTDIFLVIARPKIVCHLKVVPSVIPAGRNHGHFGEKRVCDLRQTWTVVMHYEYNVHLRCIYYWH